jgi:hypothetical protein
MNLELREYAGTHFLEGRPEPPPLGADGLTRLIEACFEHGASRVLLYPENLSAPFFDLSSGQAGAVLQKLRNYHIRLAIVRTPALRMSSRFLELLADEMRGPYFRLFDDREAAQAWLCAS